MSKRVALLGFLAVLMAANLPSAAKAWDGCYYRPCYPRFHVVCYRPDCYPRSYAGCRWCGGHRYTEYPRYAEYPRYVEHPRAVYIRSGEGYDPYGGYFRYYSYDSYDESYGW